MARFSRLRFSLGILVFLTLLSGFILTNSYAFATDDEDAISCTLSYSVDSEHIITAMNGSYSTDVGTTTFSAVCNDNAGFAIYAVGNSGDEYGNNKMIASINNTLEPIYDIDTGIATSGDTSNWAMKLSAVSGDYTPTIENSFNNYAAVPNEYQKAVSFPSTTDDTVGSELRSTYAIYLSSTQPAGTYTGGVKYTLVHPQTETPCMEGKICYHKNANNVVGSMGRQNVTGATTMLMASNFSHDGYGFAGWNTEEDGTGTSYGPNETITLPNDMSEGFNLYAMWIKSAGSLQDWGGCYEMNIGDVTALTDERDNDTYAIAKLADGKCWMIENLRLDNDATTGSANEALAQGYGTSTTYGNFSGLANPEAPWIGDSTTANSLYSIDGSDGTINIGADNNPSRRFPRYNNQNTASRDNYPTTNQNIYSYGNYYTWAAAIADLKPNGTNNKIATGTSLCPTGWRLPSGGAAYASDSTTGVNVTGDTATYRDFYNLGYKIMDEIRTAYEDTAGSDGAYYSDNTTNLAGDTATKAFRKYPNNFVLSGYVYNGSISNRNSYGLYWSSTARNTDYAYRLYINTSTVYPSTAGGNKFYGRSVRCVTNPMQRREVTVIFDDEVDSVILKNSEFGTKTITTSGTVVSLVKDAEYTISGTYTTDYGFESWATTSNGTLGSTTSAETTYTVSGTATLTLTSKEACTTGNICYRRNDTTTGVMSGIMGKQAITSDDMILLASNYSNSDYGFAGWNTEADGSGTSYGPNETVHFENSEDSLMLYAMWVPSVGNLQNWSCPREDNMPIGTVTALTDYRDNQVYAVAKLADGKCWMIENMRLENEGTVGNNINDASVTNQSLAQGYAPSVGYGSFIGLADAEDSGFTSSGGSNSIYGRDGTTPIDIERMDAPSHRMPRYNHTNTNTRAIEPATNETSIYSYGNYYTWSAATASTAYTDTDNLNIEDSSICPAGWRLPTGGSAYATGSTSGVNVTGNQSTYRDYYDLGYELVGTTAYEDVPNSGHSYYSSSEVFRKYPNNFLYSGYYEDSAASSRGASGYYWTSTRGVADNGSAYQLSLSQDAWPGTNDVATFKGAAIRCINDNIPMSIDDLEYMQDFANLTADEKTEVLDSMVQDEQYQLTDNRDNKVYYITKLGDGHVWMTQNLDYDIVNGGADINSTNTDVPSDWADAGKLRNTYQTNNNTWDYYVEEPESYDPGDWCWNGTIRNDWEGTISNSTVFCSQEGEHFHLGNYYNWTAAVASSDTDYESEENFDKDQSICPAGWTLPKDTETNHSPGTFSYLIDELGLAEGRSGNLHQYPYYYAYGGDWEGRSSGVGSYGYYNTSIIFSYSEVYSFSFSRLDGMDTEIHTTGRGAGYSLRCVAR